MIPTHFNSTPIQLQLFAGLGTILMHLSSIELDLDRERTKMENQEKKVINDIKKMAKEGQMVFFKMSFS